jgi:hypothetical protein
MRLRQEHKDEIIASLFESLDKYKNPSVNAFIEINPQNLS